jgi:DNA-binding response OmpR family regulator
MSPPLDSPDQAEGARRILVVDDDPSVREGIAAALRRDPAGYAVETAGDGFEAGVKLAEFRPELILLDVVMPGMGGLDICSRIRSHASLDEVKIVILTGYPGGGNPEKSLLYGADLFLTKPQEIATLRAHVRDLLED